MDIETYMKTIPLDCDVHRGPKGVDQQAVCKMYTDTPGTTLQAVADEFKVTRERVRQILRKHGILSDRQVPGIQLSRSAQVNEVLAEGPSKPGQVGEGEDQARAFLELAARGPCCWGCGERLPVKKGTSTIKYITCANCIKQVQVARRLVAVSTLWAKHKKPVYLRNLKYLSGRFKMDHTEAARLFGLRK